MRTVWFVLWLFLPSQALAAMDWTFTIDPFVAGTIQSIGNGPNNVTWSATAGNPGGAISTFDGTPDPNDAFFWSTEPYDELGFSGVGSSISFQIDFLPTSNSVAAGGNPGNRIFIGFASPTTGNAIGGGYDYAQGFDPPGIADLAVYDSANGDQFSYVAGVPFNQDVWTTAFFEATLGAADSVTWDLTLTGGNTGTFSYTTTLPGISTDTLRVTLGEDGGQTWWDNAILSAPEPALSALLLAAAAGLAGLLGRGAR